MLELGDENERSPIRQCYFVILVSLNSTVSYLIETWNQVTLRDASARAREYRVWRCFCLNELLTLSFTRAHTAIHAEGELLSWNPNLELRLLGILLRLGISSLHPPSSVSFRLCKMNLLFVFFSAWFCRLVSFGVFHALIYWKFVCFSCVLLLTGSKWRKIKAVIPLWS